MAEEYFGGASIVDSPSNCKLSHIENVRNLYGSCNGLSLKDKVKKIKRFLNSCRILVSIDTISIDIKNFFEENFEVYNIAKIPVGYYDGYQYHILLKNNDSTFFNKGYLRPVEKDSYKEISTDKLEKTLKSALKYKSKRKKSDIIKEVIENFK